MESHGTAPDRTLRITALPGPARTARIPEPAWHWLQMAASGPREEPPDLTDEQIGSLHAAGILVDSPENEHELMLDEHWGRAIRAGTDTPVTVDLVCVDGTDAWTTSLRIAGQLVLVVDQDRELAAEATTMRLGRAARTVTLGVTSIDHLSAAVEALVPQRPAFTTARPDPAPEQCADAPAVAEVQMVVTAAPTREAAVVGGGSFYALGDQGGQLAVLTTGADGTRVRTAEAGSLSAMLRADVIAAIDHVTAAGREQDGAAR